MFGALVKPFKPLPYQYHARTENYPKCQRTFAKSRKIVVKKLRVCCTVCNRPSHQRRCGLKSGQGNFLTGITNFQHTRLWVFLISISSSSLPKIKVLVTNLAFLDDDNSDKKQYFLTIFRQPKIQRGTYPSS